eukprot:CAMPEP_0203684588 /NCGR_PEP_ID=MMETSP0090-20130426/48114_1 /ASSEMBLY_ACC=CAM_ASM_001088 /TAXON_ID=426623 /ORGANISM="Chaetoceros affinis, Strain CCMP159" /LENGTH=423 /DNA_ID=CAMNT_0050553765 /DNA_START=1661 /DNA_END=2932 /DNA_ORIENTATION=-
MMQSVENKQNAMIDDEEWVEIGRMLQGHQCATTSTSGAGIVHTLKTVSSMELLQFKLLKKNNEEAKLLFFILVRERGRDFVWEKDERGCNLLHAAYKYNACIEVISKIIEVGGEDLVFDEDECGRNSLHVAFMSNISIELVSKLVEVGGKELIMAKDKYGYNSLELACSNYELSNDILDLLIQYGGREMLTQVNREGKTPLIDVITRYFKYMYYAEEKRRVLVERGSFFINKGMELQIGGEYSIGGLFSSTSNRRVQHQMHENWDETVLPALESAIALPHNHDKPILQAVVINKVPPYAIKDAVRRLVGSINTTDSLGRLPIDVAVQHKLTWTDGMKEIVEAFLSMQESSTVLTVCAKNGLEWENGMKSVVESVDMNDIERQDVITGLYPFMIAGVEQEKYNYDLGSVFHLITTRPGLVQRYN